MFLNLLRTVDKLMLSPYFLLVDLIAALIIGVIMCCSNEHILTFQLKKKYLHRHPHRITYMGVRDGRIICMGYIFHSDKHGSVSPNHLHALQLIIRTITQKSWPMESYYTFHCSTYLNRLGTNVSKPA